MAPEIPKILTTLVGHDDGGGLFECDTIEWEGKKWLVPKWLVSPTKGWKSPERIICLDTLPHQKMGGDWGVDFVLNCQLPRAVVEGRTQSQQGNQFVVIEGPDIKIPGGEKLN